ncbi:hypothetical protein V6N12_045325 [Hibiscus sabdariffa]|uniref:Uncharacterized protein n=1 Tax=Hibiscus sabdariffa TaxID=183260 RepID=A0ABR2G2G2_9ROSI
MTWKCQQGKGRGEEISDVERMMKKVAGWRRRKGRGKREGERGNSRERREHFRSPAVPSKKNTLDLDEEDKLDQVSVLAQEDATARVVGNTCSSSQHWIFSLIPVVLNDAYLASNCPSKLKATKCAGKVIGNDPNKSYPEVMVHDSVVLREVENAILVVYASLSSSKRKAVWAQLESLNLGSSTPWFVGVDFNVVLNPDERPGGSNSHVHGSQPMAEFIFHYGLIKLGFRDPPFTWSTDG